MRFCYDCGNILVFKEVNGDHLPRYVCDYCQIIHYQNPKIIVGCLPIWEDSVLLCKRNIEPQFGLWNVPGGFMENGESAEQGAIREVWEESKAKVSIFRLHTVFSVVQVNQVHLHYIAQLENLNFETTPESSEVCLFKESEIPWSEIAFASSMFCLKKYFEDVKNGTSHVHTGTYYDGWKL